MSRLRGERGSVTIWVLGLSIGVLFLGGISLDLWRVYSERSALAAIADAAAIAGSTGLLPAGARTGGAQLDVALAEERARNSILSQTDTRALTDAAVRATPEEIVVVVVGEVEFTLLRLFISEGRFDLEVLARASPLRDVEPLDPTQGLWG
nr:hypothetical protein [Euzebyales bacterium]